MLKDFVEMIEKQGYVPQVFECDNEIYQKRLKVVKYLNSKKIRIEPSPIYTQDLNGGAERSGAVLKEKIRAIRQGAKFPAELWKEIGRIAVYLLNRSPR